MKSKNLIVLSLLATLLVSTAFASLANAADDNVNPSSVEPSGPMTDSPTDPNQPILYGDQIFSNTINDGNVTRTTADDVQALGAENGAVQLISAQADGGDDNLWVILGLMAVSALGLGSVVGVVLYRRVPMNN
jgi:hypothetical protein